MVASVKLGTEPAIGAPRLLFTGTYASTAFEPLYDVSPDGQRFAFVHNTSIGQTPFGGALLSLLRFAWLGGGRQELYAFMRSPYSGLRRDHVDFLEGRLRGRAIHTPERVEQETLKLRGQPLPFLETVRSGATSHDAVSAVAKSMLIAAYGLSGPILYVVKVIRDRSRPAITIPPAAAPVRTSDKGHAV